MFSHPHPGHRTSASSRLRCGRVRSSLAVFLLLIFAAAAHAQGRPGGGGGGMGGPGGGGMGGGNRPSFPGNDRNWPSSNPNSGNGASSSRTSAESSALQLGPSGRWWDNKDFARTIGIDTNQQRRLDDVFSGNRNALLKLYKNLQHEESQLAKTVRSKDLDETQIFAQIDRVTQARGELEKANAHMLLQLRKELTTDQTAKLDEHRPTPE